MTIPPLLAQRLPIRHFATNTGIQASSSPPSPDGSRHADELEHSEHDATPDAEVERRHRRMPIALPISISPPAASHIRHVTVSA